MLTLIRQLRLYVTSAVRRTSDKPSSSGKSLVSLQEQENPVSCQYPYLAATNADTLTNNSNQKKEKVWTNKYSGLQEQIYEDK